MPVPKKIHRPTNNKPTIVAQSKNNTKPQLTLYSFGVRYRNSPTRKSKLATHLNNPFAICHGKTALESKEIRQAVRSSPNYKHFISSIIQEIKENKLTEYSIGCIGGKHRSVTSVIDVASRLKGGYNINVIHLDVDKKLGRFNGLLDHPYKY